MLPPNLCCDQSTVPQQCNGTHKVMRDMRVFYRVYVCVCVTHSTNTLFECVSTLPCFACAHNGTVYTQKPVLLQDRVFQHIQLL